MQFGLDADYQEIVRREAVILGTNLEHIINFTEVQRITRYLCFDVPGIADLMVDLINIQQRFGEV